MHKTIALFIEFARLGDRFKRQGPGPIVELSALPSTQIAFCNQSLELLRGVKRVLKVGTAAQPHMQVA